MSIAEGIADWFACIREAKLFIAGFMFIAVTSGVASAAAADPLVPLDTEFEAFLATLTKIEDCIKNSSTYYFKIEKFLTRYVN